MHAPNSPRTPMTAIALSSSPTPDADLLPQMSQNVPGCPTNDDFPLPTLTPAPSSSLPCVITPSPLTLTTQQLTAISLLCTGLNLDAVAARLQIHRRTLYRWRTSHPAFRAELARRQKELRDTASRRLRLTLLRAIAEINGQFAHARRDDRVKAALALLRHCDLRSLAAAPDDPLTSIECLDDQIRQDRASRNLDPTLAIDDDDRDRYLADLQADHTFDEPPSSVPTHRRIRGFPDAPPAPCPTPDDTPTPDPDFQI